MIDLKQILRERGLRQKHAAASIGVSEATVSMWIAALKRGDHQRVPAEQAKRLAELLAMEPGVIRPDLWPPAAPAPAAGMIEAA